MVDRSPNDINTFERRKTYVGVVMTIIYSIIYTGYVAISVFRPAWTGVRTILGLNLATAYGIALIIIAVALAIIYNYLVRFREIGASETVAEGECE